MKIQNPHQVSTDATESGGYVAAFTQRLLARYQSLLNKADPETAEILSRLHALQSLDKPSRMQGYVDLWNSLDEDAQYKLAVEEAKRSQIARAARTLATTDVVQAHNAIKAETAGSIDFVLEKFRAENVSAEKCQRFIDENAVAWFSLTGHPTNPTTVDYAEAQTNLSRALSNVETSADDLDAALLRIHETAIVAAPKTPLEEARETLNTLDVLYDSALGMKNLFDTALAKHGYAAEGVHIRKPLIHSCVWTLGDGDGNANMTAEVLENGIALHRRRIAERYRDTLDDAVVKLRSFGEDIAVIEQLLAITPETMQNLAAILASCTKPASRRVLADCLYLYRCFGAGFGTIDVRHNAEDILSTLAEVLQVAGVEKAADFSARSLDAQAVWLAQCLEDKNILQQISVVTPEALAEATAARILGRLRVVGQHPDMCEKLIIAETTHPAHALAALLLLKMTGNVVGAGSRMDIVVLSESVADLAALGGLLRHLLSNPTFRAHVIARQQLVVMIAKSDTTRQDGRGEAEHAQYQAAVESYAALAAMQTAYSDLAPVRVCIKNGGGHALQRGGGRVTEVPALHGRAAADADVSQIGPSTLTIQGQQMMILFCPGKTAVGTLEALAAQNLYTRAGVAGDMPAPVFADSLDKDKATQDAKVYAAAAGKAFDALTKGAPAIDDLLVAAPWLAMKAGNASSRPAKRGEKQVIPGVTPREAKGDNPRALQGRAISGERLTAHACLPVFAVLGLREAMQAVERRGAGALHHLYRAHKIHRDAARATLSALSMADFDIAWPLLVGTPRPDQKTVAEKAAAFNALSAPSVKDQTLAYLEQYFLDVEKMTIAMITGKPAPADVVHGAGLRLLWPDLGAQVAWRDRGAEFSRVIECYRTREMDKLLDTPISAAAFRITQALYTAANVVNTPVGILATRTRLEPQQNTTEQKKRQPESWLEDTVKDKLSLPAFLN